MKEINPLEILKHSFLRATASFESEVGRAPNIAYLGQLEIGVLMHENGLRGGELVEITGPARMEYQGLPIFPSGRPQGVIPAWIRESDLPKRNDPDSVMPNDESDD